MIEKSCETCDFSLWQEWNDDCCTKANDCDDNFLPWELRRDKRTCENCGDLYCFHAGETTVKCKCSDITRYWQPIIEKQKKENICCNCSDVMCLDRGDGKRNFVSLCCNFKQKQEKEMEYIQTEKFTIKNIFRKASSSSCVDIHSGIIDVLNAHMMKGCRLYDKDEIVKKGSNLFNCAISHHQYKMWLLKEGFIKEDVWFEPCLYCHESNQKMSYRFIGKKITAHMVSCIHCGATGPEAETEEEARKKWNKE